jgi:tetratricopeptide (TPR) repeat protein
MATHAHTQQTIAEIFCIILAFIPLVFIPITQNYYDTNKWLLLIFVSIGIFVLWVINTIRSGSFTVSVSPAAIGFSAIAVSSLISLVAVSTNKVDALLTPLGPITWVALTFVAVCTPTLIGKETETNVRWVLYGASATIALIALYEAFGVGRIMFPAGHYLADPQFTPTGTTTASAGLFAIMLPLAIADVVEAAKAKRENRLAFLIIIALIEAVGLGVTLWQIIPKIATNYLPYDAAWSMTLETLKSVKQAVFGIGAENFLTAFTVGRPISLNLSPIWNARYILSSNLLFHLFSIYGLLGGISTLILTKGLATKTKSLFTASLIVGALTFFLIPPNITVCIVIALLVALVPGQKILTLKSPFRHRAWLGIPLSILVVAFALFSLFWVGRAYWADTLITKSYAFAQQNNGTQTYNLQVRAISAVPQNSNYHVLMSQTTMAMAVSLTDTINKRQESSISAQTQNDRQLVSQLIQQSIQDAKLALTVNPRNVLAWENIARIYGQLVGAAQGADTWSVSAYNQVIQMDPTNPSTRLELGALYIRLANYPEAINRFQQAIALKPDYTNAYYNLSNAYKLNKDITQAISAMEQTVKLIDKNSSDYKIASQALDDLKKNQPGLPTTSTITPQTLTTPTPAGPAGSPLVGATSTPAP